MKFKTTAAAAIAAILMAGGASAATIKKTVYSDGAPPPNDCSGLFGQGFDNCVDPDGSPVIAKWDVEEDEWTFNSSFSDVTADMFTITFNSTSSGTWSYAPCAACVDVTSWVAKDGDGFVWFHTDPKTAVTSGEWHTVNGKGLSHITFYDTATQIPLPAAGWLMLAGLGGLAALRRRKTV